MCGTTSIIQIVLTAIFFSISVGLAVVAYKFAYKIKKLKEAEDFRGFSYVWLVLIVLIGIMGVVVEANVNADCSIALYVLAALSFVVSCYPALVLRNVVGELEREKFEKTKRKEPSGPSGASGYHSVPMRF